MNAMQHCRQTYIDLIRHGEPVGGNRYRGRTDDPLSELGWQQMRSAVGDYQQWDRIICSPLKRCSEFAHELAERLECPIHVEERIQELSFGQWEGMTAAQIDERWPGSVKRFWQAPWQNPPIGGEAQQEFQERIAAAWQSMLQQYEGERLLVVCHGGVIRELLRQVLHFPQEQLFRWQVPYACVSRLCVYHDEPGMFPNLISHGALLNEAAAA